MRWCKNAQDVIKRNAQDVKIVFDDNSPYIEYKSTNTVNADSVIIHVQKGQIKNNGVSTVTR